MHIEGSETEAMASIMMKGREIPLVYTVYEMKQIQDEIAPLATAISLALGRNPENKEDTSAYGSAGHLEAATKLIRILANAGLEENGENPDLTDKKIMRSMKPADLMMAISACMDAMTEGMASEIPEEKQEGPVDVTLEEINKKKERDG